MKLCMLAHTCNPGTQEVEALGAEVQDYPQRNSVPAWETWVSVSEEERRKERMVRRRKTESHLWIPSLRRWHSMRPATQSFRHPLHSLFNDSRGTRKSYNMKKSNNGVDWLSELRSAMKSIWASCALRPTLLERIQPDINMLNFTMSNIQQLPSKGHGNLSLGNAQDPVQEDSLSNGSENKPKDNINS